MAANFGDTLMEGEIAPSAQVQNPVEDRSGEVFANAMAPVAKAVGAIAGGIFANQRDSQNASILAAYEEDLLSLADAVDQGELDRNAAMIRARNYRRQYLANAPALQADFDKVWGNFAESNGLGHVVVEGTLENQAQDAMRTEAMKLGYPDLASYQEFLAVSRQAQALNQQWEMVKANNGIVTDTMKAQGLQVMVGLADKAYPAAQKQINDAVAAIAANPADKANIINTTVGALNQQIAQMDSMGMGADTKFITDPIRALLDTFTKTQSGELENSVLENALKFTQLQYDTMFTQDPVLGPFIAQSNLLKAAGVNDMVIAEKLLNPDVLKALKDAVDPARHANILANTDANERFTQTFIDVLSSTQTDPAAIEETKAALAGIVDGAYVNERAAADGALGWKGTVEVLGSQAAADFVATNGPIPAAHAAKLVPILKENYEKELVPAIQQYWAEEVISIDVSGSMAGAQVGSGSMQGTTVDAVLQPVWNGAAVEFVPKPGYEDNPSVRALADDVNGGSNSIGVPLNNLIRAHSLLTGVDPKTVYEQQFQNMLFGPAEGEEGSVADRVNAELDATDADTATFTLGDFNPEAPAEFVNQAAALETSLPPIDMAYTDIEGIDYDSYLPSIRASESGGNDSAKNPSSTATGRYQFLTSTWNGLMNKYPELGLTPNGRTNPQQQERAIRVFTAENARALRGSGIPLSNGTLYAAHFLGASDAVKALTAADSTPIANIVPARTIQANPFLRGMTAGQFKAWANRKGNA